MSVSLADAWQNLLDSIRNLLHRPKSLDDFSYDELRTEHARLEAAEQRILRELDRLEKEKATLFEAAKKEPSRTTREIQARKIRDINQRSETLQGSLRRLSKLIRVVDSIMAGQEQGRLHEGVSPIVDSILDTDDLDLRDWADSLAADEMVTEQKMDQLIEAFQDAEQASEASVKEDAELTAILVEIEQAATADAAAKEAGATAHRETPVRELAEPER